jgi:DNA topoisomerase-3
MRLFIAEKPELAKAITTGLSGTVQREDGYFKVGNDLVTWAYGHILGLADPESYDEKYKSWKVEDLPFQIDIDNFKYIPKDSSKKQLNIIVDLINNKDIKTIVNAGDNDEEGQILVDEILAYADNKKPVQRVLISDLTEKGAKKALQEIKSNDDFKGLSDSGFARSQADWLVGLNLTRAYTTLAQAQGYQGVLSVGRVQTPILG